MGFLPKMVSKRVVFGYRITNGLLKGEAETPRFWVSVSIMVSAGIGAQALHYWVSFLYWPAQEWCGSAVHLVIGANLAAARG